MVIVIKAIIMANTPIEMKKVKQIFRFYTQGISKREISKRAHVSRNTVKKYIAILQQSGLTSEEVDKMSYEDIYKLINEEDPLAITRHKYVFDLFPQMSKELKKVGVTRYYLWERYKEDYPQLPSYSRFCELYRVWGYGQNPVMRFDHKAGDKLFIDYTGKKLSIVDKETGELEEVEVFIATLGASGYTYVEACHTQTQEDFIRCLANSLEFFEGVPQAIIPDNLKAAVTKSNKYEPIINENLLSFALHYDTTILPTRAYKPRDKALVENAVKNVYTKIFAPLSDEVYHDIYSLNKVILVHLDTYNKTPFQSRKCSRLDLYVGIDKPALSPLPTVAYQLRHFQNGTVYKTSHIYLNKDKHHYSVPYKYIGKKVRIIYTDEIVEVYIEQNRVAVHSRVKREGGYTTIADHMPSNHRFRADWNPEKFLSWAKGIGQDCYTFTALLLAKKQHPEQSYKSLAGILSLAKKVGKQRLNNACRRAIEYERVNYQSVKSILEKGLDTIQEDTDEQADIPNHPNIRGKDYYQ